MRLKLHNCAELLGEPAL